MSKEDWLWVAIRVFGIYLLVLAVTNVPSVFSGALRAYGASQLPTFRSARDSPDAKFAELAASFDETKEAALSRGLAELVSSVFSVLLFGALGVYLIRNGRFLFKLVTPPSQASGGPAT